MTKILLVEDDPMIYRMYQKLFTLEGYETEIAVNGQEGLDKLANFKPDVILLDIMMPTMNGLEMLDKLKADPATATIPTVVLTNVSDMRISNEVFSKGANLSIVKSEADPDQVIAWIKSVIAKASAAADEPTAAPVSEPIATVDEPTATAPSEPANTADEPAASAEETENAL